MIKCIIFDLGGPIIPDDTPMIRKALARELGISTEKLAVLMNELHPHYTVGKITLLETFSKLLVKLGKKQPSSKKLLVTFIKALSKRMLVPYPEALDFVDSLRKKYKTALLTNTEIESIELFNGHSLFSHFDKVFISTELKMRKPNPDIYHHVLNEMGYKPHEAVFIDDRQENVDGAVAVGIKGLLYKDLKTLKQDFRKILH
ncbi:MAG: HAD family phosphatase [Nanoarchaeota archaeon]